MNPNDPLSLLIPVVGIALVLGAVWLTRGAQRVRLDRPVMLRRLAEDAPDFIFAEFAGDLNGQGAIASERSGPALALLWIVGNQIVVRLLSAGAVRRVERRPASDGTTLAVETGDFTLGQFALRLPSGEAERWAERFDRLARRARAA